MDQYIARLDAQMSEFLIEVRRELCMRVTAMERRIADLGRADRPAPGVDSPLETSLAIRGADEGGLDAPVEINDSTASGDRAVDEDAPQ